MQTLVEGVSGFVRYVLHVDVGHRADGFTNGTYVVALYGGASLLAHDNSQQAPPPGGFVISTVVYDAMPCDPAVGSTLQIELVRGTGQHANFDDVRLYAFDVDCNNNGIVDKIDISNGLLPDADGESIADDCGVKEEVPGDLTGDGVVGPADLAQLLASWGTCAACAADFNNDGIVGPADLAELLANWG